jgi:hypothetical protein
MVRGVAGVARLRGFVTATTPPCRSGCTRSLPRLPGGASPGLPSVAHAGRERKGEASGWGGAEGPGHTGVERDKGEERVAGEEGSRLSPCPKSGLACRIGARDAWDREDGGGGAEVGSGGVSRWIRGE